MDFVPLHNEQYDLVIPREFYDSDLLQPLLTLIRNVPYRNKLRRWEASRNYGRDCCHAPLAQSMA